MTANMINSLPSVQRHTLALPVAKQQVRVFFLCSQAIINYKPRQTWFMKGGE